MSDEPIDKKHIDEAWKAAKAKEVEDAKNILHETLNIPASEAPEFSAPTKPAYLDFLGFFAGLNLLIGIFAVLATILIVFNNADRRSSESSYAWIISLAIALEGFLAYGLLSAVRDIADNMIDVGSYVRDLRKQGKFK